MKIVIAPDSFKESLTALEVAQAIETGFKAVFPQAQYHKVPMADGGEGTVQAMVDATQGDIINLSVTGPLGQPVAAFYGMLGSNHVNEPTAIIEMAAASGLHHVPNEQRNPLVTTSFGTGELIKDALNKGVKRIILGLGGSATNDAGAGMLQALGFALLDKHAKPIDAGGAALVHIDSIDTQHAHPQLAHCQIDVACDVDNPLCGPTGATAIFGPQKGATELNIIELDNALSHFATISQQALAEQNLHLTPGAGAAGGMGFGVTTFLNATLLPGVEIVTRTVKLAQTCQGADLVITGEGRIDGQTVYGKTPMGVLNVANAQGVPVIAIAGCLGDGADQICQHGMKALFPVIPNLAPLQQVLDQAEQNVTYTARNIATTLSMVLPAD